MSAADQQRSAPVVLGDLPGLPDEPGVRHLVAGLGDNHVEVDYTDLPGGPPEDLSVFSPMGQAMAMGAVGRSGVLRRPGWPRTAALVAWWTTVAAVAVSLIALVIF